MRGRGKTRIGMMMVTGSSVCILATVILLISGFGYSDRVIHDEGDFSLERETLILDFENDLPGVLTYEIDSEEDLRITLRVENRNGRSEHRNSGKVPLSGQVTLDAGRYSMEVEITSGSGDPGDLDIEIRSTGDGLILTCCGVAFTGSFSFLLLLFGAVVTMIGAKEARG